MAPVDPNDASVQPFKDWTVRSNMDSLGKEAFLLLHLKNKINYMHTYGYLLYFFLGLSSI